MKKAPKKKRARRAASGVTTIRFDSSDRERLGWLQDDLGGLTLAAAVKWAVKEAYDRRRVFQKIGLMAQELRGTMPTETPDEYLARTRVGIADALQLDIRKRVQGVGNENK